MASDGINFKFNSAGIHSYQIDVYQDTLEIGMMILSTNTFYPKYLLVADEAIDKIKNDLEIESYAAVFDVYREDFNAMMGKSFISFMKKYYNGKTKLLDIMKIIFNPTKAGFTIAKSYADLPEDDSHEVWTDSDSLLILEDYYDKFIERVRNEIS